MAGRVEDKNLDALKDTRRRNSLAFYISRYVEFEDDDFGPLVEEVRQDKLVNNPKTAIIKVSSK